MSRRAATFRAGGCRIIAIGGAVACAAMAQAATGPVVAEEADFFESRVRPLLVSRCAECHSSAHGAPEGGLSFDSRRDFLAADGVAVAGRPDESLLVKAVRYDGRLQMPPDGRLPDEEIRVLEEWVRRGLPWPDEDAQPVTRTFDIESRKADHWCWQPPRRTVPPVVSNPAWCRTDLDRFVLARLEAAGLAPASEASPAVLVRRASEILTGLPADPDDVDRVANAPDPQAFEAYVERLLASPHYGERFARHWLDVVRYGETRGHEFDYPIPNAWQYRDWVVRALNADLPYDQFVREQIAGDLVRVPRLDASGRNESVLGTGFWLLGEEVHAPVDIRQDEADRMDNRVDTFGKAFLGLAMGCARCHDHKFDAISAADYYAIAGMAMSSSYRQVPFESLEENRRVQAQLSAWAADARRVLGPLIAEACGPGPQPAEATTGPPLADTDEVVIADYMRAADSTPLIVDGAAWELVPAGQPLPGMPAAEHPGRVGVEPFGHARSDAVWTGMRSRGERDPGVLGDVDRAGRVLRTPKRRITEGVLWHRVRGNLQIFVVVDGHVLLQGAPLHGVNLMKVDTEGAWKWIRQDLLRDIKDWSSGHVVHVEYAAISGAAGVAEVVAGPDPPTRVDPPEPARFAARLAAHDFDWASPAASRLSREAERLAAVRQGILAEARLESAIAPALLDGNGIDQHILAKGSAARPGRLVPRRFLEAIDGSAQPAWPQGASGRLELADRVVDPVNPLTSRVIVNRIWHHLFGRGLVPTPDNFGVLGEPAADPLAAALLDTLAVRFREEGWSIKRLVREIVGSSTWRMSSVRAAPALERDPLNLLLHHYPLRRLEAEAIRDKILAVSGRLDRTVGGPSIEVSITEFQEGRGRPKPGPLDGGGRRSLYTRVRRNFLPPLLVAFDMPVPFQAMGRRTVTNVPAQALALANDPFVSEQAAVWARRILADASAEPRVGIRRMLREAFARAPEDVEVEAALAFLEDQAARHGGSFAADPRQPAAWADLAHALVTTKEFIFVP